VRTGDRIIAMLCCAVAAASVAGTRITMARAMDPSLAASLEGPSSSYTRAGGEAAPRWPAAAAGNENSHHPADRAVDLGIVGTAPHENAVTAGALSDLLATFLPWAAIPFVAVAVFFKWVYRGNSTNPDDDGTGTVT
jgi:hypothetical protein